jgi:hypothetical protein
MPDALDQSLMFRRQYSELLRHFIAGRLTNDKYEDAYFELEGMYGRDPSVWAVFSSVWHFYDDLSEHRMTGDHRLTPEWRRRVARWIVFLRSGAPLADVSGPIPDRRPLRTKVIEKVMGFGAFQALQTGAIAAWHGYLMWAASCCGLLGFLLLMRRQYLPFGASLSPQHAAHALSDDPADPWPFRSPEDLHAALEYPTYLHG